MVLALSAVVTGLAGCATAARAPSGDDGRIALNQCVVLEPGLYRCPGVEPPLCTPDFKRDIDCMKISADGVPLPTSFD